MSDGYPQLVLAMNMFLFKESRFLKPVHVLPAHTLAVRAVIVPNRKRRASQIYRECWHHPREIAVSAGARRRLTLPAV